MGMKRLVLCLCALCMVSACGQKRPLVRPKDIPAYEAKKAHRQQQFETGETPDDSPVEAPSPEKDLGEPHSTNPD
jgi:predicted small lipoprotein YifL